MAGSWGDAEALGRPLLQFMGTQPVPKQSPWEAWKISHLLRHMRQYPNRQHAHLCKTEDKELSCCSSKRPYKVGHPWRSATVPLQAPDPRRHLLPACESAPGPTSWIWHLCCPSKRDRLVFGSCAGGSGGNYWLNLRHDTGNPTDLKRI